MKIDTQGMSIPLSEHEKSSRPTEYPPFNPIKLNAFTDKEREELKELMREVLNGNN